MKKIVVALIGNGFGGKVFHQPLLNAHEGFELRKILTSKDSLKEILNEDPSIELVVNCGPNNIHYSHTKIALEMNRHVVVDKPFVVHSKEGEELIELSKQKEKVLSVFHNRRWDSDFLSIKKLIESGELGEIKQFESHFDRFVPGKGKERRVGWREKDLPGSGSFFDLGSHLIDQALVLFGKPQDIYADVTNQGELQASDDYFHLNLIYPDKRVILHGSSYGDFSPRFLINGSRGCFVKYGMDSQEGQLKAGLSLSDPQFGVESEEHFGNLKTTSEETLKVRKLKSERGAYLDFYEGIYQAIRHQKAPPVLAEDALEVIKLMESSLGEA